MKLFTAFLLAQSLFHDSASTDSGLRTRIQAKKCDLWTKNAGKKGKKANKKKNFNRIATFPVCSQLDSACNVDTETSAEIVAVSEDGMTLIYSDSPLGALGFVDITDPANPTPLGTLDLGGEPTSVSVLGKYAIVAVNTSEDYVNTSGFLAAVKISSQKIEKTWDLGGQPDSVAVSPDGKYIVVAIENERDEDLGEGIPPQMPAGYIVCVKTADKLDDFEPTIIDITGLDGVGIPEDPEPEFVSINENNIAVVTLQENNAIILIDLKKGKVKSSFSAGTVDLKKIDTEEEGVIDQTSSLTSVPREPDGVVFMNVNYFATADEGDMYGGSRGFTIFDICGNAVWSSKNFMDQYAASVGHYPEERSENKGVEPENVAFGSYSGGDFLFVNAERANLIYVYDVGNPKKPKFHQVLPTNVGPEGGLTIPSRNLFVVANEVDARDDKMRSTITIYEYSKKKAKYPTLISKEVNGLPIAFGALSGLSPDPSENNVLYTLEDSFYMKSRFFKIKVKKGKASKIAKATNIVDTNGIFAAVAPYGEFSADDLAEMINDDGTVNIDGEGIAADGNGSFYIASEGRGTIGDKERPIESLNFIFKVDEDGVIQQVITLPDEWNDKQLRFGLEGVAYNPDSNVLVAVLQRAWGDDTNPAVMVYSLDDNAWAGYGYYPLETPASQYGGWVGLSDITYVGDGKYYILERDNQGLTDAAIKRIYCIDMNTWTGDGFLFSKDIVSDIINVMDDYGTLPMEKYEGLAYTVGGVFIVNDGDGVDDNSGELQLLNLGDL